MQLSWCYAKDVPLHPGDRELKADALQNKLFTWLRRHDQETSHLPSIYPLAVGLPIRLTENVDRNKQLYRGRKGTIYGWTLAPGCIPEEIDGEFLLSQLPLVIYIIFPEATWRVGKLPSGVYPLKPRSRTWKVNKYTGIEARRTGFWFLPDFGSTAHMIQGDSLEAAFVDLQEACSNVSSALQIAGYVCLSRIKELLRICVLQPFSPLLFTRGPPAGPERLIRKLEKKITVEQCFEEWANDTTEDAEEKGAAGEKSPMASKHLCTSCYLKGKEDYMLPAKAFGIKQRQDYYPMYVTQGAWTRCLQCDPQSLRAQRMETEPSRTAQETEPSRTAQETEPTRTAHAEKTANMVCAACYNKACLY